MTSWPRIDGLPAREELEVLPQGVRSGGMWYRTLAIEGWPDRVSRFWLQPLLGWRRAADIALYFEPVANDRVAGHREKQRTRFPSFPVKGRVSDGMKNVGA